MFYCDPCAKKHGYPFNAPFKSFGPCEICKVASPCNDVPSRALPTERGSQAVDMQAKPEGRAGELWDEAQGVMREALAAIDAADLLTAFEKWLREEFAGRALTPETRDLLWRGWLRAREVKKQDTP